MSGESRGVAIRIFSDAVGAGSTPGIRPCGPTEIHCWGRQGRRPIPPATFPSNAPAPTPQLRRRIGCLLPCSFWGAAGRADAIANDGRVFNAKGTGRFLGECKVVSGARLQRRSAAKIRAGVKGPLSLERIKRVMGANLRRRGDGEARHVANDDPGRGFLMKARSGDRRFRRDPPGDAGFSSGAPIALRGPSSAVSATSSSRLPQAIAT